MQVRSLLLSLVLEVAEGRMVALSSLCYCGSLCCVWGSTCPRCLLASSLHSWQAYSRA